MAYFTYHNKQVFYEEIGQGRPLLLLHGNTASSKLFEPILDLYKKYFKVILIDFQKEYKQMINKIPNGSMHFFQHGGHPAMLTSPQEFFIVTKKFIWN